MSTELSGLFIEQEENFNALKRILVNYKKLPKPNVTLAKTKARLQFLENTWRRCTNTHIQLRKIATAEELKSQRYFVSELYLDAEEMYQDTADHLHEAISRLTLSIPPAHANQSDSSIRESNSGLSLQLPRISLPKFSGNYSEWENFRNTFESLVARNEALANTQKFYYLKSSVTGNAALLISCFKISDVNYEAAWKLLIDEFDDKPALIHTHIHAFVNLPVMKTENAVELKKLRDTMSASLAALSNLDRPVNHWDDLLVYIISQKFSTRTRIEWNLKRGESTDSPTYKELNEFLTCQIRGLTDRPDSSNATNLKVNKPRSVNNVAVLRCIQCSGNHALYKCEKFLALEKENRGAIVKQHKLCFNCLKSGHFTTKCPSKARCSHCRRAHHSVLHHGNDESSSELAKQTVATPLASPPQTPNPSNSIVAGCCPVATVQNVNSSVMPLGNILLATAWVDVHTTEGRRIKVRALLDQGSSLSFISEFLCQSLRTRRQRTNLQIQCFGKKFTGYAKGKVALTLTPCSRATPTFPLTAYVFQRITSYAASRFRPVDAWPHLRNLPLADPDPSGAQPIHMLIGAGLYSSLLNGDLRKGPIDTPTAQGTAFG